jgi:hypothetical protein
MNHRVEASVASVNHQVVASVESLGSSFSSFSEELLTELQFQWVSINQQYPFAFVIHLVRLPFTSLLSSPPVHLSWIL